MNTDPKFIFAICQTAATATLRTEIPRLNEGFKLAFSQPGFATFKLGEGIAAAEKLNLRSTLARTYGWIQTKLKSDDANELVDQVLANSEGSSFDHLHVFQRETYLPGEKNFEPGISPLAEEVAQLFAQRLGADADSRFPGGINQVASPDQKILDVILVQPNEWWIGYHYATARSQQWVGGVPALDTEQDVLSRAYFKLQEALLWSGFRMAPDEVCVEIGSAPGGACQRLLEMGQTVIAVDPALMDEEIAEHPNLTHIRKRGRDVRKKELSAGKWLLADLNIAPNHTLDTVEDIVTSQHTQFRGLILTLKVSDWSLIESVPEILGRVKEMGFLFVRCRQLAFNRKEICLVAARDKFDVRKQRRRSTNRTRPSGEPERVPHEPTNDEVG